MLHIYIPILLTKQLQLLQAQHLRLRKAIAMVSKVKTIGGWDVYGGQWVSRLLSTGNIT